MTEENAVVRTFVGDRLARNRKTLECSKGFGGQEESGGALRKPLITMPLGP